MERSPEALFTHIPQQSDAIHELLIFKKNCICIIIIILIKRCSLTRVKLTALYKHLMTKTTLTHISNKQTLSE